MELITTAIFAALAKLAEPLVKDGYEAIKNLISRKFGNTSDVAEAVEKLEKNPTSTPRQEVLKEEIAKVNADKDEDIIKAAELLLEKIKAQPGGEDAIRQAVNQHITGSHNIFTGIGDIKINKG